jgi:hypothetical protein
MTDLPKHSTNNNVEIEVDPAANVNQADMLCMVLKLINDNPNGAFEKIAKLIDISKQITIYFTSDLCRIYNESESTIYNYRISGKLNLCSEGQKVWFTQEQIDEFNWLTDRRNKQSTAHKIS